MKVGFTGTRDGMTKEQEKSFIKLLKKLKPEEFRHGDCTGSDANAHTIAKHFGIRVVIHPPSNSKQRAFMNDADEVLEGKGYLDRNHDIVDSTDILVATPDSKDGVYRSGTWATVRYAARQKKPTILIFPDGIVEKRGFND